LIVQSLSSNDQYHTIEIKSEEKYAGVTRRGYWIVALIKCIIKIIFKPDYYSGSKQKTMERNRIS
jgi:hypothetical protein